MIEIGLSIKMGGVRDAEFKRYGTPDTSFFKGTLIDRCPALSEGNLQ
jgi:hypothetical protein